LISNSHRPIREYGDPLTTAQSLATALLLVTNSCATARTTCPIGTELSRQIYSGGAEAEYCHRPDGIRQGPETRYYESGAEHVAGEYLDGAQSGVWRYRFSNGRNWRAERWDDGALVSTKVDPAVAGMSEEQLAALGPTDSNVIKLTSHDPRLYREARERGGGHFDGRYDNGRPRVAGDYDADGLRSGIWRFWNEDGRLAREIEFVAGVRERMAREWHPNGQLATEGFYVAGEREGQWRWWDAQGKLTSDAVYSGGKRVAAPPPR
jgi:antitoxin component YwqK of YwqJK toxin-antitoxin module